MIPLSSIKVTCLGKTNVGAVTRREISGRHPVRGDPPLPHIIQDSYPVFSTAQPVHCPWEIHQKNQPMQGEIKTMIAPAHSAGRFGRLRTGFTLIELIMVMVIVSILAIAVMPRFTDQSVFESRGFHDETLAFLRYAQKTAIAQRRTVCVTFTTTNATLNIASTPATASCDTNLIGPKGDVPGTITAKSGTSYVSASNFSFNGLGQPSIAQTIQVVGAAGHIVIEADTGYVHE